MMTPPVQGPVQQPLVLFSIIAPTVTAAQFLMVGDGLLSSLALGIGCAALATAAAWLMNPQLW